MPVEMLWDILLEIKYSHDNTTDFWDKLLYEKSDKSTAKQPKDILKLIAIDNFQNDNDEETFTLSDDKIELLPASNKTSRTEQIKLTIVQRLNIAKKESNIQGKKGSTQPPMVLRTLGG